MPRSPVFPEATPVGALPSFRDVPRADERSDPELSFEVGPMDSRNMPLRFIAHYTEPYHAQDFTEIGLEALRLGYPPGFQTNHRISGIDSVRA
jgi:hypothetical protein